ncbi:MAG TPA: cupredoxin domain-containing protein [Patescibacteria group bacterium]|nr:cupredoxin domain-containing protein [Patescibacteria group bacterium]
MSKILGLSVGALVALALVGAGCNNTVTSLTGPNDGTDQGNNGEIGNVNVVKVEVTGKNFTFSPSRIEVKKGQTVELTFKNESGFHDFVLDKFAVKTTQMQGPATQTATFVASEAGEFEYYCSVGKHRELGMKGVLVVTE